MMFKRWKKIEEDFFVNKCEGDMFDLSKLPEICDNIVYDMIHYPELRADKQREKLLRLAQLLCMVNVPCEYGITNAQKCKIGMQITNKLIDKIHGDLVWWKNLDQDKADSRKTEKEEFKDEDQSWN